MVLEFCSQELRERMKPYFLRRMKSEVSLETGLTDDQQLPKKNELIIWLKLTDLQVRILVSLMQYWSSNWLMTILQRVCLLGTEATI